MNKNEVKLVDIMLDLEFFGTEEDMVEEYPEEDAFPIVTSIGIVAKVGQEIVAYKEIPLNMIEQLENGAKFGTRCMSEFWTKQPLFGQEFNKAISQKLSIEVSLLELSKIILNLRKEYPYANFKVWGNNLIADNAKVIRLYSKYSYNPLPWTYFENVDLREMLNVVSGLGFSKKEAEIEFNTNAREGKYKMLGFPEPALHNPVYDCLKQLYVLEQARLFLQLFKE